MSQSFHTNPFQSETGTSAVLSSPKWEQFWREQLKGLNRESAFLAAAKLMTSEEDSPGRHTVQLNSLDCQLTAFSAEHGISKETLITAAWARVLSGYHPEQQALFGIRFAGKTSEANQLWPVFISIPQDMPVTKWLEALECQLRELMNSEPASLIDLHLWFEVPACEHLIESIIEFGSPVDSEFFPFRVVVDRNAPAVEFNSITRDISTKAAVRVSRQFFSTLERMVQSPSELINNISILSDEEREQILVKWNQTETSFPLVRNLQDYVEAQVARTPDGIAVEFAPTTNDAIDRLSYRELNARANQVANHLRKLGIGPDSIVGICAERSVALAVAVLGIIKSGAAYVPFDPGYPRDRLEFMISDTRAPVILTQKQCRDKLPPTSAKVLCLDSDWGIFAKENTLNPPSTAEPDHLAYLIYTSGSTGKPKGVAMCHGPLVNLLHWQLRNFSLTPAARTLQFASINFDVSFQEFFSTWCSGGTLVLIPDEERRDSRALVHFLQRNRIERLFLPFVALKHLAEAANNEGMFPERLREVITAGEQLQITPQLATFFQHLPKCSLENQYGPSETHVVTACRMTGSPDSWKALPPIGKPIANTKIYLLDAAMRPVPIGVPGELYIGGDCLARGYLNRPDLTAERFMPDPFANTEGARLYKTGDLARFLPDGNIEFLGRIDHQVKIRGFRIELGEIESLLARHPSVREAIAVAHNNESGEKLLVAYVVPSNGDIEPQVLRDYLKDNLPPYAVPNTFVSLPKLPINPNGKVDRRALPAPPETVQIIVRSVRMPRDPLEMQVALVFEKFFKQRPMGIDANFFEIGGDSLQALRLVLELERVTGNTVPISILYKAPTVEKLAEALRERCGETAFSSLVPLQPLGSKPPLYLVHTTPGDVLGYGNLIYHLHDQRCYGLQSRGMEREDLAHQTIPEMAAYYIELIRAQQPHGPYHLGGWCYGGIIAVEMAHQLLEAGERIAPLILIETPAPAPSIRNPFYFLRRISCALNMTPHQWKQYLNAKFHYYRGIRTENEKRYKRVESDGHQNREEIERHNRFLARLEHLYQANLAALKRYRSRYYPGKIVLFNAAEQDPAVIYDPLYGWPGLAKEIQAHVIPGDHDTILMEPHVRVLAAKLAECLHDQ